MVTYDPDEQALAESVERGEWQSVPHVEEEIRQSQAYARATFEKKHRLSIRLPQKDWYDLKLRALQEGLPSQTLVVSIVHKYLSGRLTETTEHAQ